MILKKDLSLSICTVFLCFTTFSLNTGVYNFFERLLFGFSIIQIENKELCDEAKDFLDVSAEHQFYYSKWPWTYFSSFTQLTGTWIDKEVWDDLSLQEKIFLIYHETSHKALHHPIKQYVRALSTFVVSAYLFHKLSQWGRKPSDHIIEAIIAKKWGKNNLTSINRISKIFDKAITTIVGLLTTLIVSSFYSRQCEQEADEKAIEALCLQERTDIVQYEIDYLKNILANCGNIKNLWFPSIQNQIHYFENALKNYS